MPRFQGNAQDTIVFPEDVDSVGSNVGWSCQVSISPSASQEFITIILTTPTSYLIENKTSENHTPTIALEDMILEYWRINKQPGKKEKEEKKINETVKNIAIIEYIL